MAIDRLIARRDVHLREQTLWRTLYETVTRAEEILEVNIEELDLAGRRAPVKAKCAQPRTRSWGAPREEFVLEPVYWGASTARLLPRLIKGRTRGPGFVTHRRPGPGKVLRSHGVCPDTGPARLSYGQARALLEAQAAGERAALFPSLGGGDRRSHQRACARRQPTLTADRGAAVTDRPPRLRE